MYQLVQVSDNEHYNQGANLMDDNKLKQDCVKIDTTTSQRAERGERGGDHPSPLCRPCYLVTLVEQYRSDCVARICSIIASNWAVVSPETYKECYEPQIDHWQATIKQIDSVLTGTEENTEVE